jgi:hypothetical protein
MAQQSRQQPSSVPIMSATGVITKKPQNIVVILKNSLSYTAKQINFLQKLITSTVQK